MMTMKMTATAIESALMRAHPDTSFCELSYQTLAAQEAVDKCRMLAELGQEALAEEPLAQRMEALAAAVQALGGDGRGRKSVDSSRLLLSLTAAARLLGCDPGTPLRDLITRAR